MAPPPAGLEEEMRAALGARVQRGEPLGRYTSFRIGGPADLLLAPDGASELAAVLRVCAVHAIRPTILGGGSNVLVGDGIRGVVVKLGRGFARLAWSVRDGGATVRAGAAVQLGRLARAAVQRGLAGLEFAEGIPGTVGGALFMNAGAYGGDVSAVVDAVEGFDGEGAAHELSRAALPFAYRRAGLPAGFVVTAVRFALRADDQTQLAARMAEVRAHRVAAQPNGRPCAGSIFKNPAGDHAGRLIEAAGLKGRRAGKARISERHANFIVNEGGAHAADVKALMDLAQRVVWERSGVWLEPEVRLVGSW